MKKNLEENLKSSQIIQDLSSEDLLLPSISSVVPDSAPAGAESSQITINGSGFGALQGAVNFFYYPGGTPVQGYILSWSDTAITCIVPFGASSGPMTVITSDGKVSSGYNFTVTFGLTGLKWFGIPPSATFYLNENTPDCVGEGQAVQTAATTWNAADSAFKFQYGGSTATTVSSQNFQNEILWGTIADPGIIAQTVSWGYVSTGQLLEFDIVFNEVFTWSTSDSVPYNRMDVQTIALHELGHAFGLADLYGNIDAVNDTSKVMYGFGGNGTSKRALSAYDVDGMQFLYPDIPSSDEFEPDNDYTQASTINPGNTQEHVLAPEGDEDWVKFAAVAGYTYVLETSGQIDTYLELYNSDGTTLIGSDNDGGAGLNSRISWNCPTSGTYFGKVRGYSSDIAGLYSLSLTAVPPLSSTHFPAPVQTLTTASFSGALILDSTATGQVRDAAVGDEVAVYDGSGILCGRFLVDSEGQYGPLIVYGDDPITPEDEGASAGEVLTFRVWDYQRQKELPARTLQPNGNRQMVTWSDNGGGTVDLQGLAQDHIGVFRVGQNNSATWYLDADGNGSWGGLDFGLAGFGLGTDQVAVGDWNGDGITDPGTVRFTGGYAWWYFDSNGNGQWDSGIDTALQFGIDGDIPVVGDWNGDGKSDFGAVRNVGGLAWWYFDSNGNRQWDSGIDQSLQFGIAGDIPVVGDWNGDGMSDFGAVRFVDGYAWWYFDSNGNRQWDPGIDQSLQFGIEGDIPVVGDWNGDGISDFGVMRNGIWYLDGNGNRQWDGGDLVYPSYGVPGDQPVGGVWR